MEKYICWYLKHYILFEHQSSRDNHHIRSHDISRSIHPTHPYSEDHNLNFGSFHFLLLLLLLFNINWDEVMNIFLHAGSIEIQILTLFWNTSEVWYNSIIKHKNCCQTCAWTLILITYLVCRQRDVIPRMDTSLLSWFRVTGRLQNGLG